MEEAEIGRTRRRAPTRGKRVAATAAAAGPSTSPPAPAAAAQAAAAAAPQAGRRSRKRAAGEAGASGATPRKARSRAAQPLAAAASPGSGVQQQHTQPEEKRTNEFGFTVSWRPKPSKQVQDRIQRALPGSGHRLFLIDRRQVRPLGSQPDGAAEEFHVLGATGNVYTVTVGRHPRCTCPDFAKGNICKHYLFVQLRVLRLPQDEPVVWQAALLPSEADEVLSGRRSAPARQRRGGSAGGDAVLAPDAVRREYARLEGGPSSPGDDGGRSVRKPVGEEDDCPICFDALAPGGGAATSAEALSFCASCGNNEHAACMQRWARSKAAQGAGVTCPLCRAAWVDGAAPKVAAGGTPGVGQYVNLGQYSEAHRHVPTMEELYGESAQWIGRRSGRGWW